MTTLVPVILCGGSGTRMWPLSRRLRPKQLLPLTGTRTLLHETIARLDGLDATEPVVVCGEGVRFAVAEQLAAAEVEAAIVVEPAGRNTAPAIGAAVRGLDGDPYVLVCPSDHHVADPAAFRAAVAAGLPLADAGHIVVFGVPPTHPATGFGYVQCGAPLGEGFEVATFTEKPDATTAKAWVEAGTHWWNAGVFLFRRQAFLDELARHAPAVAAACTAAAAEAQTRHGFVRLGDSFLDAPSVPVDVAVMERTDRAAVVPLDAGWQDLGTWSALWAALPHDDAGNATTGDVVLSGCRDSLVHASRRLVVALDLVDHVVVETADAVLVAPRRSAERVKDVVAELAAEGRDEVDSPTVVLRPWGAYEVLHAADGLLVKRLVVAPGEGLSLQLHAKRRERWVVVRGRPVVTVGDVTREYGVGEQVAIEIGQPHRLENPHATPAELVEVQLGDVDEKDVVRLRDRYDRLGDHG